MFNSLTGIVTGKGAQKLFLETNGIEWDITVPESSLEALPPVGEKAKVYVWLQHTDVLMTLFGFASNNDRELFFALLKVDGIGPKGAVKIMANITTTELEHILDSGDIERLQKVPGVGKKTAAKMLLQLKGKLSLDESASSFGNKESLPFSDVIAALVDMGYERKNAESAVEKIVRESQKSGTFENMNPSEKEDFIFRSAIMEMAK